MPASARKREMCPWFDCNHSEVGLYRLRAHILVKHQSIVLVSNEDWESEKIGGFRYKQGSTEQIDKAYQVLHKKGFTPGGSTKSKKMGSVNSSPHKFKSTSKKLMSGDEGR